MGTISQKLQAILTSKAAIKAAIEEKGVSDVGDVLSQYASKIASIPAGGGGGWQANAHCVRWWDIDGTMLKEEWVSNGGEAKAPTTLPTHEHLTFARWNHSDEVIGNVTRPMDIGAVYDTEDDALWLQAFVPAGGSITLYLIGPGVVSWGDGQTSEVGSYHVAYTHTYSSEFEGFIKFASESYLSSGVSDSSQTAVFNIRRVYMPKTWTDMTTFSPRIDILKRCEVISLPNLTTRTPLFRYITGSRLINALIFPFDAPISSPQTNSIVVSFSSDQGSFRAPGEAFSPYLSAPRLSRIIFPSGMTKLDLSYNLGKTDLVQEMIFTGPVELVNLNQSQAFQPYVITAPDNSISMASGVTAWSMVAYRMNSTNLVRLFRALATTSTAVTIKLPTEALNSLTDTEKAIATNKGYTLTT